MRLFIFLLLAKTINSYFGARNSPSPFRDLLKSRWQSTLRATVESVNLDMHFSSSQDTWRRYLLSLQTDRNFPKLLCEVSELLQNTTVNGIADRNMCNMGINAALKIKDKSSLNFILNSMVSQNIQLEPDTVHIMLKFAFDESSDAAELIFNKYFGNLSVFSLLKPNIRTLNTMMEGHRRNGRIDRVVKYYKLFDIFHLAPDAYTYTSLLRIMPDSVAIIRILDLARKQNCCSGPVVRCALETLGEFGTPEVLLSVASPCSRYLSYSESVYTSTKSADALISALLNEKTCSKFIGNDDLMSFGVPDSAIDAKGCNASKLVRLLMFDTPKPLLIGEKGICLIFKYIHQRLKIINRSTDRCNKEEVKELMQMRQKTWEIIQSKVKVPFSSEKTNKEKIFRLNGRIVDALLRTYLGDVRRARVLWTSELYPLALTSANGQGKLIQDIAEKGLEALMYVSASSDRADIGLEIAITARKRKWKRKKLDKLAQAYAIGRQFRPYIETSYLTSSFESSIESELGQAVVLSSDGSKPRKIRIRY
jgi:pentatricopeptide repeat protein